MVQLCMQDVFQCHLQHSYQHWQHCCVTFPIHQYAQRRWQQ